MNFKKVFSYCTIIASALIAAMAYAVLVFPNSFAPAGVNGICTIIQEVFHINIGYMSLIINIPLAILVYIKASHTLAIRSMVYVGVFSIALILLKKIDLSAIEYCTENGTSKILGPLIAGIVMGCVYSILLRIGAYTGGTDFVSVLVHTKNPGRSVFYFSFIINSIVALMSFFVYGYKIEPVFLSILYSFASTSIADRAMRSGRSAMRFVIITNHGKEIAEDIISTLHHSATIIESKGAYTKKDTNTIICVVNNGQISLLYDILGKYPGTFATADPVSEILGNFKKLNKYGNIDSSFLDPGDYKI